MEKTREKGERFLRKRERNTGKRVWRCRSVTVSLSVSYIVFALKKIFLLIVTIFHVLVIEIEED